MQAWAMCHGGALGVPEGGPASGTFPEVVTLGLTEEDWSLAGVHGGTDPVGETSLP